MKAISKLFGKAVLISMLISLLTVTAAIAAPGDLDPLFSGDGKLTTDVSVGLRDKAYSVAVQSDGKILMVGESYDLGAHEGDLALVRYYANGGLDKTFNGTGKVITDLGGVDQGRDIVIQPDGKIVVSGRKCNRDYSICDLAVLRYKSNGQLDPTFNGDGIGIFRYKVGNNGTFGGLELAADGKILVAGYAVEAKGMPYDFAIYRLLQNGYLDKTFSDDGVKMIEFGTLRSDVAQDLVIQPDGKIVAAGYTCNNLKEKCHFAVARIWRANGAMDLSFSGDGMLTTDFGGEEQAPAIALQTDGKIVLAGRRTMATSIMMAMARYNPDGSLDTGFNGSGKKLIDFLAGYDEANYDVLVQPDGKIVTLGYVTNQDNNFAIVRLKSNGSFDETFGINANGKVEVDFGFDDYAFAIALDLKGRYLLAGRVDNGSTQYFALARVLP